MALPLSKSVEIGPQAVKQTAMIFIILNFAGCEDRIYSS